MESHPRVLSHVESRGWGLPRTDRAHLHGGVVRTQYEQEVYHAQWGGKISLNNVIATLTVVGIFMAFFLIIPIQLDIEVVSRGARLLARASKRCQHGQMTACG